MIERGRFFARRWWCVALSVAALWVAACSSGSRSPGEPMPAGGDGAGIGGGDGSIDGMSGAGAGARSGGAGGLGGTGGMTPIDVPMCEDGLSRCGTDCVDPQIDVAHCGECDAPCATGMECSMGACVPVCNTRIDCAIGEACVGDDCTNPAAGRAFGDDESRDPTYGILSRLDVAATGHAAVVWETGDYELRVSRYLLAQEQWSAPLPIHEAMAPFPGSPHVGLDDAGNAIAVWHQGSNENQDGWANRYDAELDMWLGAERIEPEGDGFASSLHVAMDGAGNATVVWPFYREGGSGMVRANRYDAASASWTGDVDVSLHGAGPGNVTAAADVRGNVMAVWEQAASGAEIIDAVAARYDVESGTWGEPIAIDGHDLGHANHPNVTADADGNFFVGWHQSGEDVVHVWVNRYDSASGRWGTAQQLDTATGSEGAIWAKLGADHHGNCLAIWEDNGQLMSALYSGQWSNLGPVSDEIGLSNPRLAVDRGGNGLALYSDSGQRLYVSRFDAGTRSWGEPESIDPVHADRTSDPSIDVDAEGRAVASWHGIGESGSWEVITNRFE